LTLGRHLVDDPARGAGEPTRAGQEATVARDVAGSSWAITVASRSCQTQPDGGTVETASNSTRYVALCFPSSPSPSSVPEVMTRRRAAVEVSTTSTEARMSGRLGPAAFMRSVGNIFCLEVSDDESVAATSTATRSG
jgi:hypothetical protein